MKWALENWSDMDSKWPYLVWNFNRKFVAHVIESDSFKTPIDGWCKHVLEKTLIPTYINVLELKIGMHVH